MAAPATDLSGGRRAIPDGLTIETIDLEPKGGEALLSADHTPNRDEFDDDDLPSDGAIDSSAAWYAIWTRSHCERLVAQQLMAKGFQPFLPEMAVRSRKPDADTGRAAADVSRLPVPEALDGETQLHRNSEGARRRSNSRRRLEQADADRRRRDERDRARDRERCARCSRTRISTRAIACAWSKGRWPASKGCSFATRKIADASWCRSSFCRPASPSKWTATSSSPVARPASHDPFTGHWSDRRVRLPGAVSGDRAVARDVHPVAVDRVDLRRQPLRAHRRAQAIR